MELRREGGAGGRDAYQRKEVGCAPLVPTPPVRRSPEEEAGRGGDRQFVLLPRCLRLAETRSDASSSAWGKGAKGRGGAVAVAGGDSREGEEDAKTWRESGRHAGGHTAPPPRCRLHRDGCKFWRMYGNGTHICGHTIWDGRVFFHMNFGGFPFLQNEIT